MREHVSPGAIVCFCVGNAGRCRRSQEITVFIFDAFSCPCSASYISRVANETPRTSPIKIKYFQQRPLRTNINYLSEKTIIKRNMNDLGSFSSDWVR